MSPLKAERKGKKILAGKRMRSAGDIFSAAGATLSPPQKEGKGDRRMISAHNASRRGRGGGAMSLLFETGRISPLRSARRERGRELESRGSFLPSPFPSISIAGGGGKRGLCFSFSAAQREEGAVPLNSSYLSGEKKETLAWRFPAPRHATPFVTLNGEGKQRRPVDFCVGDGRCTPLCVIKGRHQSDARNRKGSQAGKLRSSPPLISLVARRREKEKKGSILRDHSSKKGEGRVNFLWKLSSILRHP